MDKVTDCCASEEKRTTMLDVRRKKKEKKKGKKKRRMGIRSKRGRRIMKRMKIHRHITYTDRYTPLMTKHTYIHTYNHTHRVQIISVHSETRSTR